MIISQTPLRLSFLGGNTDFASYYTKYGGFVLTTAIDKYVYCIVKERFDDLIRVKYSIQESVEKVDDLKHELVREAMKMLGVKKGIEIAFLSDIPGEGSGLGSSSSVTVGVLNALHNYIGAPVSPMKLAEEAVKIEVGILKKPIGVQDQYITALGGLRWMEFMKDGAVKSRRVHISEDLRRELDSSLMLFYTGITRSSSKILSSLDLKGHQELLHKNKSLAIKGVKALNNGQIEGLGNLLDTYWQLKKQLSNQISNPEIDKMYDDAMKAGAFGGKIAGAGGGGFLLLVVPFEKRKAVKEALKNYKELPVRLECDGSKVIFNIRRYQ
jgi:D-glycero-alpha-D-manno-heptose-7-phosphate kinase